tara:strand:+ start:1035 stop:1538 length:504 start_codon:yes stop_codon:yes gene_type:complete
MKRKFIYPASYLPHKNHRLLLSRKVVNFLNDYDIEILMTIDQKESNIFSDNCHRCIGEISRSNLLNLIKDIDAVVFLSSFESLGIPLIEAANLNKSIICPELDYAKELLGNSPYYFDLNNFDNTFIDIIKCFIMEHKKKNNRKSFLIKESLSYEKVWEIFLEELKIT